MAVTTVTNATAINTTTVDFFIQQTDFSDLLCWF